MFGLPRPLVYALGALMALVALYLLIDAYGDARYKAGVSDTDLAWKAAGEKLEAQAKASAKDADAASVKRVEAFNEQVAREKEELDDAIASGDSPLDVLFGGMSDDEGGDPSAP
jgi:hypothetical protein